MYTHNGINVVSKLSGNTSNVGKLCKTYREKQMKDSWKTENSVENREWLQVIGQNIVLTKAVKLLATML
jgi:hypothetical protein